MAKTTTVSKSKGAKAAKTKRLSAKALAERKLLAAKIKGKYAWIPDSVDDFIKDKRREIALENRA